MRALRAELFKLRSSPGTWAVLWASLLLSALGVLAVFFVAQGHGHVTFVVPHQVARLRRLIGAGFGVGGIWLAAVVGVLCVTGEDRHSTTATSLLVQPRRGRLLAAKAGATVLVGLLLAIASLLVVGALGLPLLSTNGGSIQRVFDQAGWVLPELFGAYVLVALFGLGLGTLLKNQTAAVVGLLGLTFVIEPVLDALAPHVGRWFPVAASGAMAGGIAPIGERQDPLVWWAATAILLGWSLVPLVLGALTTLRRDVT